MHAVANSSRSLAEGRGRPGPRDQRRRNNNLSAWARGADKGDRTLAWVMRGRPRHDRPASPHITASLSCTLCQNVTEVIVPEVCGALHPGAVLAAWNSTHLGEAMARLQGAVSHPQSCPAPTIAPGMHCAPLGTIPGRQSRGSDVLLHYNAGLVHVVEEGS